MFIDMVDRRRRKDYTVIRLGEPGDVVPMKKTKNEISQSMPVLLPIIFSAGLHDAYSFFCRGGVFANAQTGNIVLMSMNIASGNAAGTVKYIVPLAFFTLGVIVAKVLFLVLGEKKLFWKQAVLLAEAIALFAVGFMPQSMNLYANAIVSFACAMQVHTFNKIYGNVFASTMCIGNLVRTADTFVTAISTKDKEAWKSCGLYFTAIVVFAVGAAAGYLLQNRFGNYAIMFSAALAFLASFAFIGKERRNAEVEVDDDNKKDDESEQQS